MARGYDSLDAVYAAHEEGHPDIRNYAERARIKRLRQLEDVLAAWSPAQFETTADAAIDCILAVNEIVAEGYWQTSYDSLESFYAAHEAPHPDIRVYDAVAHEVDVIAGPSIALGRTIAQRIGDRQL